MYHQLQEEQIDESTALSRALMLRNELLDQAESFRPEDVKKLDFNQLDDLIGKLRMKESELSILDASLTERIYLPEHQEKIKSFIQRLADLQVSLSLGANTTSDDGAQVPAETGPEIPAQDKENSDDDSAPFVSYMLLMDSLPKTLNSEPERSAAVRTVRELLSDKSFTDEEARRNCIGIQKFLDLSQKPLLPYLTNEKSTLHGMKLFPVSYPDSVLDDIADSTFRLKMPNEKADITQKVAWSRIRREEGEDRIIVTLINSVYLAKLSVEFREYLYVRALFLGVDPERLKKRYERASGLSAQKREELSRIAGFFQKPLLDEED